MKKFFILALFVLGMCNAPVFGMEHEIVLTELYSIMPLDDPDDDGAGGRPNPNQFRAFISGNLLSIGAYTDMPAYVEVIDDETGEVVADDEFDAETETTINKAGSYIVQIYSGNTIMTGEFEVE
ncbi:MAG: hypothetical protein IJ000_05705 [Paludibacteraceae bacterium]|nr:hypothetical protein [Paludibacteraceae bacterium]